jgi:hypothetical protein
VADDARLAQQQQQVLSSIVLRGETELVEEIAQLVSPLL